MAWRPYNLNPWRLSTDDCAPRALSAVLRIPWDAAPNPTAAPLVETIIGEHGDSDFLQLIAGRDAGHVWAVIDGVMETLKAMEPRLYAGVIRRINE